MRASLPIVTASAPAPHALPTVLKLQALWQGMCARPLWAPERFWRYLALRRRMRLKLVEQHRLRLVGPKEPLYKTNQCQDCTDICCVGPHATVLLRFVDMATLIDIGRADLMTHQKPGFAADALRDRPLLRRQVRSTAWQLFPVLKKDSMNACQALRPDGRCGLYPHWPLSCARFPYALNVDDGEIFYSRRCQAFRVGPQGRNDVRGMAAAAVAGYNERIKDALLLAFARHQLEAIGLTRYLGAAVAG